MKRKSLIYKTGVEYGDYTLNHVFGCSHGCKYPCYAFMMSKRFGRIKTYEEWIEPQIIENALELLDMELPKYKSKIKLLHLCFMTDPFMFEHNEVSQLSMQILQKANAAGIHCSVLTKGVLPPTLAELPLDNEYGITVISLNEEYVHEYEPGAAPVNKRIAALRSLSECGKKTWVSIEPYPTPNIIKQDLHEIMEAVSFTDRIIFGRLHYNKRVTEYPRYKAFYNQCSEEVIRFCEEQGIDFHIKNGTITEEAIYD